MIILTIRTDNPLAEIGLFDGQTKLAYETWQAHRQLAETIHQKIDQLLTVQGQSLYSVEGIVVFQGPGSFTGLRIGLAVANALAYGLEIPIIASNGKNWIKSGIARLQKGETDRTAVPNYGSPARTTEPKK